MHGERSGNGKQIWESGQYYIGEWKHGHPEGKGVLIDPNVVDKNSNDDGKKSQTIGIWGQNGLVKELVVGKSTSKHNNNNVSNGGEGDDDVPIFTSIKTTLQTRKVFPQQ